MSYLPLNPLVAGAAPRLSPSPSVGRPGADALGRMFEAELDRAGSRRRADERRKEDRPRNADEPAEPTTRAELLGFGATPEMRPLFDADPLDPSGARPVELVRVADPAPQAIGAELRIGVDPGAHGIEEIAVRRTVGGELEVSLKGENGSATESLVSDLGDLAEILEKRKIDVGRFRLETGSDEPATFETIRRGTEGSGADSDPESGRSPRRDFEEAALRSVSTGRRFERGFESLLDGSVPTGGES